MYHGPKLSRYICIFRVNIFVLHRGLGGDTASQASLQVQNNIINRLILFKVSTHWNPFFVQKTVQRGLSVPILCLEKGIAVFYHGELVTIRESWSGKLFEKHSF